MKILITGATGLLGRALFSLLKMNNEHQTTGIGFSRASEPVKKINLRNSSETGKFIEDLNPDLIVHSAAERRPDVSEADPAGSEQLNVEVTGKIAEFSKKIGASVLYISTDYVFDGKNPPYYPDSITNPLNFYGKTKLAGEQIIKESMENYTILRVPILYGTEIFPLESSVSSVASSLLKHLGGKFDDTAVRYPTHTGDVAIVIERLLDAVKNGVDITGTLHFSGKEALTKYKMAQIMAPYYNVDYECIYPDRKINSSTVRPKDCHLDVSKLKSIISLPGRSFSEGIIPVLKTVQDGN